MEKHKHTTAFKDWPRDLCQFQPTKVPWVVEINPSTPPFREGVSFTGRGGGTGCVEVGVVVGVGQHPTTPLHRFSGQRYSPYFLHWGRFLNCHCSEGPCLLGHTVELTSSRPSLFQRGKSGQRQGFARTMVFKTRQGPRGTHRKRAPHE